MIRNTCQLAAKFSRAYRPPQAESDLANMAGYIHAP